MSDSESANSRLVIIAVQASSASSGQSTPLRTNDSSCSGSSLPTVTVAVLQLEEAAGGGNVAVLPFEEEAAEAEVRSACNACVELSERDLRFFPRTRCFECWLCIIWASGGRSRSCSDKPVFTASSAGKKQAQSTWEACQPRVSIWE
jgi:hypothetical protein